MAQGIKEWILKNLEGLFILFLIIMLLFTIFAYGNDTKKIKKYYNENCYCYGKDNNFQVDFSELNIGENREWVFHNLS